MRPRAAFSGSLEIILLLLSFLGTTEVCAAVPANFVALVRVTGGLSSPVGITNAGDGSNRLFIVEQTGRIRIFKDGQLLATPFLDVSSLISCCGERGLLGLAFPPNYESSGFFYVDYTRTDGDVTIARYRVSANPDVADPAGTVLLTIEHSAQGNHNGGQLQFGPDGYLYIGVGDGGGSGDPFESGQSVNTLLGKLLRIDVSSGSSYAIPAGNPFAGPAAGLDEIWAYGLRNPWRFSFDRLTGDLYIGDVGQNLREEIDFQTAGSAGGQNYGWDCREGTQAYNDTTDTVNNPPIFNADCPGKTFVEPVLDYGHGPGCSITGGYVYRGLVQSSQLTGNYLYSDFCDATIRRASRGGGGAWSTQPLEVPVLGGLSSFGESESGRIYATYLSGSDPNTLYWLSPYTFRDVPPDFWAWSFIEALAGNGITGGCATDQFCPNAFVTRAEAAVFLVRGLHGAGFTPPPASGTVFQDVPASYWAAAFIEQVAADGIARGCSATQYCPDALLTRAQASVLLLRARHGQSYTPPAATGTRFNDVPDTYWAASWIEQLAAEGITGGCGSGGYCPDRSLTRAEMAVLLSRTLLLPLP